MESNGRGVLSAGFRVLRAVGARGSARLTDVVADTGLPKATARRLLAQLLEVDALQREGNHYRLGICILRLGQQVRPHTLLHQAAERPLRHLAEDTGMSVGLVGSVSGGATFLQVDPGSFPLPTSRQIGDIAAAGSAAARAMRRGAPRVILDPDHRNGVCCVAAAVPLPDRSRAVVCLVMPHKQIPPAVVRSAREAANVIQSALATDHRAEPSTDGPLG